MHGKEGKIWFGRNLMGHVGGDGGAYQNATEMLCLLTK